MQVIQKRRRNLEAMTRALGDVLDTIAEIKQERGRRMITDLPWTSKFRLPLMW